MIPPEGQQHGNGHTNPRDQPPAALAWVPQDPPIHPIQPDNRSGHAVYASVAARSQFLLGLFWERPMHPYELVATLRERGSAAGVAVKHSSVYSTVERLHRHGLIAVERADRQGNRPERTVYSLTPAGHEELKSWLAELLEDPTEDPPRFDAALALVGLLEPARAAELLTRRSKRLTADAADLEAIVAQLQVDGLPYLAVVELDYRVAMSRAQAAWVRRLALSLEES
ncbi:PadR family transcriptional regulator [Kribbella sp. NPDC023855]|uniref:PadR family transcriptional regulator n=1 Tax=Kribbella sp. NPDC023855 TaxID=3154698 RepID=UPI0033F03D22